MRGFVIYCYLAGLGEVGLGCYLLVPSRGAALLGTWPVAAVLFATGRSVQAELRDG